MIQLGNNTIMVTYPDGSATAFDADSLHSDILHCFNSGMDSYLAEDVALAVEFALSNSSRPRKVFTESEINSAVVKILEQIGLVSVANLYLQSHNQVKVSLSLRHKSVQELLTRHLANTTEVELTSLAEKVVSALEKLNISEASPALYLELARHFINSNSAKIELPTPANFVTQSASSYELMSIEQMQQLLSTEAKTLCNAGVLNISPVRKLFPSIRFELTLVKLVDYLKLDSPVTEMMLTPQLFELARAIHNLLLNVQAQHSSRVLPVYMNVPDLKQFAETKLLWSWPEAEKSCIELLDPFKCEAFNLRYK